MGDEKERLSQRDLVLKKKKEQEFRLSLERLDKVVKEMIVPLEF